MKFLAIDVGTGTQDIMFYDDQDALENAIKMVLPSPTTIIARKIKKTDQDLFLNGETMGGGPINRAINQHLKKGYRVIMTEKAARTVRDDLKKVQAIGVDILNHFPENYIKSPLKSKVENFKRISLGDVDLDVLSSSLSAFNVKLDFDRIGVAVQDHGYSEGMGDRNFRFLKIKEKLRKPLFPEEFAYKTKIPYCFTRMNAVKRILKKFNPVIMDSKFAAVCGATCDPYVQNLMSYVIMDVGNGHTLAASIEDGKIRGVFEHHTRNLTPGKLNKFIKLLVEGDLTNEEIYNDNGHGAWVLEPISRLEKVVLTGPRRKAAESCKLPTYNACPAGDVMMAGPVGLIKSIKFGIK